MAEINSAVRLDVIEGVATMWLTRGASGNGFDMELTEGLTLAARAISLRDDLRCVAIRADGPNFSVGGDLAYFTTRDATEYGELFGVMIDRIAGALVIFEDLDVPIIAGVQGWVVGAGIALTGVADMVIAADDSRFRTAFTGIGLPGDAGVSWYLTRAVGYRRATTLIFENEPFSAAEAADWGLVTRVVPRADLESAVDKLVGRIAAGPTRAFGHARRNLRAAVNSNLVDQLARERSATVDCAAGQDVGNAIRAFGEKRSPIFEGR